MTALLTVLSFCMFRFVDSAQKKVFFFFGIMYNSICCHLVYSKTSSLPFMILKNPGFLKIYLPGSVIFVLWHYITYLKIHEISYKLKGSNVVYSL